MASNGPDPALAAAAAAAIPARSESLASTDLLERGAEEPEVIDLCATTEDERGAAAAEEVIDLCATTEDEAVARPAKKARALPADSDDEDGAPRHGPRVGEKSVFFAHSEVSRDWFGQIGMLTETLVLHCCQINVQDLVEALKRATRLARLQLMECSIDTATGAEQDVGGLLRRLDAPALKTLEIEGPCDVLALNDFLARHPGVANAKVCQCADDFCPMLRLPTAPRLDIQLPDVVPIDADDDLDYSIDPESIELSQALAEVHGDALYNLTAEQLPKANGLPLDSDHPIFVMAKRLVTAVSI